MENYITEWKRDLIGENYVIVKGSNDLLAKRKELFVGFTKIKFGFEGFSEGINKEFIIGLEMRLYLEKPTLDDIIVYTAEGRGAYASRLLYKDLFFCSGMWLVEFCYASFVFYVRAKCVNFYFRCSCLFITLSSLWRR